MKQHWIRLALGCLFFAASGAVALGGFTLPPGFTIEQVAGEPVIRFPMFAAFDKKGRLFVTESSGGDLYKEISDQTRRCRVRLLEDRDGDGNFEHSTVFAERINFPMGLAWRDGKLYLADPPDLVTLEDADGDGRSDKRQVVVTGFGHRDNGSLHGLTFGPDGWLYMTCGEPDGYKLKLADGSTLEGHNGALLRCRPDGSDIEVLCRGFVNLVEVVFTPAGEIIGTDNWFQLPSGGLRDGLVHLVPGGLYPLHLKDVGTQQPVMGDPLPAVAMFPAVALSGLARYEGNAYPVAMHGNLFAAQHNARKVSRHVLSRNGSTFQTEDHDFVTSDDPDFHPSDVVEAPDGSLFVVDTGSWYIHHCPTGRIRKSPATGGIYRVRFAGGIATREPRGEDSSRIVWDLARTSGDGALTGLRRALTNSHPDASAAAARALALRTDRESSPVLARLLFSSSPKVRLASAEALSRCGTTNVVDDLWKALEDNPDRFLEHALTYAAHHLADEEALARALKHPNPRVQRIALLLLDQPPRPREALRTDAVLSRISSGDIALRQAALHVLQHRPEWAKAARNLLRAWTELAQLDAPTRAGFADLSTAFKTDGEVQKIIGSAIESASLDVQRAALELLPRLGLRKAPEEWIGPLQRALSDQSPSKRSLALKAIGALNAAPLDQDVERVANDPNELAALRVQALSARVTRAPRLAESQFRLLVQQLNESSLAALAAADVLSRAQLTDVQLTAALKTLPEPSAIRPATLIAALRECSSATSASALLDSITPFAAILSDKELSVLADKVPGELQPRVARLRQLVEERRTANHQKLDKFTPLLEGGDTDRGRVIFSSPKAACSTCHAVGTQGGQVGPDLTRIGAIRSGRDILESILLPSSTFAQTYEPYAVLTTDGRELMGTLARQASDSILFRDSTGNEIELPRELVRELRRQEISIMPEGLEGGLSETEFRDLLGFLQNLK